MTGNPMLGLAASCGAILTAYVRLLGSSTGLPQTVRHSIEGFGLLCTTTRVSSRHPPHCCTVCWSLCEAPTHGRHYSLCSGLWRSSTSINNAFLGWCWLACLDIGLHHCRYSSHSLAAHAHRRQATRSTRAAMNENPQNLQTIQQHQNTLCPNKSNHLCRSMSVRKPKKSCGSA